MSFADDFREAIYEIDRAVPAISDQLTQAMFAFATRQHILWVADAGRAKTMTAKLLFGIFPGAPKLTIQMARDTQRDEIFGAMIADRLLKEGREIYNLEGGVAAVVFWFADEFFDGPDMLLRMLLTTFNERRLETKDQVVDPIPLHTVIMTTNFFRDNEATRALLDRILFKCDIPRARGLLDRLEMYEYRMNGGMTPKALEYEALDEFSRSVPSVKFGSGPRVMHAMLMASFNNRRRTLIEEAIQADAQAAAQDPNYTGEPPYSPEEAARLMLPVTPRTEVQLLDLPKAAAALNNRGVVEFADLQALRYGLVHAGNDDPSDEQAWTDVCGWLLPKSQREAEAFEGLAQVAVDLADIRKHRDGANPIALTIGGTAYTALQTDAKVAIDRLIHGGSNCVQQLGKWIKAELDTFDDPGEPTRFPWFGDWA